MKNKDTQAVVLFDGVCNVCNVAVDFILRNEKDEYYQFASLQSEIGAQIKRKYEILDSVDSIIVIEDGHAYTYSDAALKIVPRLQQKWHFLKVIKWLPKPVRDGLYRQFAKQRYRLFGKREVCRIPTSNERERFLS
ncbi:thiol-disulfide oxidoreductase DCC family protein [Alkalihalophilus sp. As8PL]|uniref:Thiol-disulfide oxidoreductase DCC family protein n=1 Tax=Alkalihalophilus sp. As8PL TaxID=3237103 RepID=A0AB39BX19_9BACI